jgi:hypothetical protein
MELVSGIFLTPSRGSNPRPEECRRHPPTTKLKDLWPLAETKKKDLAVAYIYHVHLAVAHNIATAMYHVQTPLVEFGHVTKMAMGEGIMFRMLLMLPSIKRILPCT